MSFTSNRKTYYNFLMAVPKKRTSISKKRIRKNIWKRKGYRAALKAFSLAKSLSTGSSRSFFCVTNK
nr:ribosomal protein L32 [Malus coronaria]UNH88746.1 ribosomal protein L32 [Malus coronaria]